MGKIFPKNNLGKRKDETLKDETEIWVVYIDDGDLSNPPKPIAHFQTEELAEKWVEMIPPFCAHVNFSVSPAIVANKAFMPEEGWT